MDVQSGNPGAAVPDGTLAEVSIPAARCGSGENHGIVEESRKIYFIHAMELSELQAVALSDGSTAFIQQTIREGLEAVQLEDGSTAFIHQAGRLGSDTIAMLQNYTSKESVSGQLQDSVIENFCVWAAEALELQYISREKFPMWTCRLRTLLHNRAPSEGEKPFRCPFEGCGRSFTTSNIRKVHTRTHTGERPYLCDEPSCGRAFASATNYKNHMRIHTGEKPYLCTMPGCGKSFTEYSSLYKHHVVHTHCKPYTCSRCGKNYRQTSTLTLHKRSAHGDFDSAEDDGEVFQGSPQTRELNEAEVTIEMDDATSSQPRVIDAAVTMVTQDSVTIALPRSQSNMLREEQQVAMVTEGHELQPVTIVTSASLMTEPSHQQVALLAAENSSQIAVQLEDQQTLEEAITMATVAIQHSGLTFD
ncbi:hypothetical protein DNTS_029369 [Danionella cerebrum]|uniref:Transcription factor IIIA n=1 Tax=Danionella cerebrum TaxID=2873325 RepID=A0A553Q7Y1_9TELE|nr:hypothetical protein DNTS_029369 [Danionella translucida]